MKIPPAAIVSPLLPDKPASRQAGLEVLDELLANLPDYAGSPELLATHLEARGYSGRSASVLRSRTDRLFKLAQLLYGPGRAEHDAPGTQPFAVYYGLGKLRELSRFETVVVHPAQYTRAEVEELRAGGTRVLAYLSLGEDNGPGAPWHLDEVNTVWNTRHVALGHPGWRRHLRAQIAACTPSYQGFLLDTLEVVDVRSEARPDMLALLSEVRRWAPQAYLLANRGFSLLPELGTLVNGVLIESFSTTWEDGYRKLDARGLAFTDAMNRWVRHSGLDVYALDYATTPQLTHFAKQRAAKLRVPTFVSTRELHHI